jgi:hypothetical protein
MKKPELFIDGFHLTEFPLADQIRKIVDAGDWAKLDDEFRQLTNPSGELFQFLKSFHDFASIEFIISIRDAKNEWEEDGIWHDDGSRVFSFSISLSSDEIDGGYLGVRRQGEVAFKEIPTPIFGGIILFLTGAYGFEHKIHQVTRGRRVVVAGWCS